ncbi:hypothetical protein C8R47DRAFT_1229153 [Mycena vitilis]|nr:hypothetical protein C8R47DRAFT_1229153 [Mycena vitilis]
MNEDSVSILDLTASQGLPSAPRQHAVAADIPRVISSTSPRHCPRGPSSRSSATRIVLRKSASTDALSHWLVPDHIFLHKTSVVCGSASGASMAAAPLSVDSNFIRSSPTGGDYAGQTAEAPCLSLSGFADGVCGGSACNISGMRARDQERRNTHMCAAGRRLRRRLRCSQRFARLR